MFEPLPYVLNNVLHLVLVDVLSPETMPCMPSTLYTLSKRLEKFQKCFYATFFFPFWLKESRTLCGTVAV